MNSNARSRANFRTIALAVLAAVLTWLVVTRSLAAYLADAAPGAALWLNSREPKALVNLADLALNSENKEQSPAAVAGQPVKQRENASATTTNPSSTAAYSLNLSHAFQTVEQYRNVDLRVVHARAETALMSEPLNARALRVLGQVADLSRKDGDAWKLMQAAARLSLHETVAVYWLMRKAAEAKDYKAVLYDADVLLRARPEMGGYVVPIMALAVDDRTSDSLLKAMLAGDPPWREEFFSTLPSSVRDLRVPFDLLNSLKTSARPATATEIDRYLESLVGRKHYDLAYYTWLQFLPAEELRAAGLLFNGSFEYKPSGMPFDWFIKSGSGVTVEIVRRPDRSGEHALQVDFQYGRVDYQSVTELVFLSPGTYRFAGKYKGEIAGPRGLKWRIICAPDQTKRIAESAMIGGVASTWRDVGFEFTVPKAGCRAQYVKLDLDARMASEQLVSGSMLFDGLQISRLAAPQSGGAPQAN